MKFSNLTIYKHRDKFLPNRNWVDLYALYEIISYLKPREILEVGYHQGLTFGLLYETLKEYGSKFTSIDITYNFDILSSLINLEDINFNEVDSANFTSNSLYDFIIIDGGHNYHSKDYALFKSYSEFSASINDIENYEVLVHDFENFSKLINATGIIMIDGPSHCLGLSKFIDTVVKNTNYKPIIIGHQQIFLSRYDYNLNNIVNKTKMLLSWNDIHYNGYKNILSYTIKNKKLLQNFSKLINVLNY